MWRRLHAVSQPRAILEVAHKLNLLSDLDLAWLMREIGEEISSSPPPAPATSHLEWDASVGALKWGNDTIRQVRLQQNPNNLQQILDAFQEASWAPRIANPLRLGPQQLHQALRSLNSGLDKIRFGSIEGGTAIVWSIV